ncbi:hypothetical protein M422DRAFT_251030, partial [Sphaerobolus stellatus SS14]
MVRATRSTAALQTQQTAPQESPQTSPTKKPGRKRKRSSVTAADGDGLRANKQRRGEAKQEDEGLGAGDLPLDREDAAQILDVLEMQKAGPSKDSSKMYSLRTLLKDPSSHPLRVIRAAIQPLFPISSHPRTRISSAAGQQIDFCNLALSLLDESSQKHPPISLSETTLLPESEDQNQSSTGLQDKRRRYALVQRLPGGDWWTSANSTREGEPGLTASEAKELVKGQSELVSILPSLPLSPSSLSKLGELQMDIRRESRFKFKSLHISPRSVSAGTFLDYGPNTSFAPAFDSEGAELGRDGLGQILMGRIDKRKVRELRRKMLVQIQQEQAEEVALNAIETASEEPKPSAMDEMLSSLFPDQELGGFKEALQLLQVETDAAILLEKNARALERLNLLQTVRLREGGQPVSEDSEECKLAQEIFNSLTVLVSLRPRAAASPESLGQTSLIPPASVLRALQSTFPSAPAQAWQGTLEESRKMALQDDSTVHVKAGASVQNAAPVAQPAYAAPPGYAPNAQYRPPPAAYPYHAPVAPRPGTQTPIANPYYPNAYLQNQ